MVYLDHTATTPVDPRVLEAMLPYFQDTFGNPSSVHAVGRAAKAALEDARVVIARCIGAEPGEVHFLSGGTESDNTAVHGALEGTTGSARSGVVTTCVEHHAVLDPCKRLEATGRPVHFAEVDGNGSLDLENLKRAVGPSTALVSIMSANNETGVISPVHEIGAIVHAVGAVFHTDAVQALGRIPVHVGELAVDLLTVSAHKIYGPKGIGALFIRKGTPFEPMLLGGGQERGRRPGTESVPLAVGFARAVQLAVAEMAEESARVKLLRDSLQREITQAFPGVIVNGDAIDRLPHILSISFDSTTMPMEGEMLVPNMDLEGIAVSSGSACTSGSVQPSHVLIAMGRDVATAKATLRFSFGRSNGTGDIPHVLSALRRVLDRMR
jgi:cysteine desulfurase